VLSGAEARALAARMTGDGRVFPATAAGYLDWQRSTRPRPSDAEVARAAADLPERERLLLRRAGIPVTWPDRTL
jgi:hypothetical protein